jgi:Family of unknown function (DUF6527)
MSVKIFEYYKSGDLWFHCPGCGVDHPFRVGGDNTKPQWKWNGSLDKPSFTPSLVVFASEPSRRCHLIMTDGKIQFLNDCYHELKGQTVDCPDWKAE